MGNRVTLADLLLSGVATSGLFPHLYTEIWNTGLMTRTQYLILKDLWDSVMSVREDLLKQRKLVMVQCGSISGFASRVGVTSGTFKSAVEGLEQLGVLNLVTKNNRITGLGLDVKVFNARLKTVMPQIKTGISPFDVIYSGGFIYEDVEHFGKAIEYALSQSSIKRRNPVYSIFRSKSKPRRQSISLDGGEIIVREPVILGLRQPIFGQRVPLIRRNPVQLVKNNRKINLNAKKYAHLTDAQKQELQAVAHMGQRIIDRKLERFRDTEQALFTDEERECLEGLVPYYENLVCLQTGTISYKLLNNAQYKKRSRNWAAIWKIWCLCKEKEWDYKVYLDSQFESFQNWAQASNASSFPQPNMLYSERAVLAFEAYIYRNETSYQNEGYDIKVKPKNVGTYQEEVEKRLRTAVDLIKRDIVYWAQSPAEIFQNVPKKKLLMAQKAKSIMDHWVYDLPSEYLAVIPEFLDYAGEATEYSSSLQQKLKDVEDLQNNMAKMRVITSMIRLMEREVNLNVATDLTVLDELMDVTTGELW